MGALYICQQTYYRVQEIRSNRKNRNSVGYIIVLRDRDERVYGRLCISVFEQSYSFALRIPRQWIWGTFQMC